MKKIAAFFLLSVMVTLAGCTAQPVVSPKKMQERVEVRIRWAQQLIQKGQFEEAKRPLTQALELAPENVEVLNLMAVVFQEQGEFDDAEKYYKKMLATDPKFIAGQNNYGIFLMYQQRYEEACEHLKVASSDVLYESRPQALENLAGCYQALDKTEEAKDVYNQVLRFSPYSSLATIQLANIYMRDGDTANAWLLFNRFSEQVNLRRASHTASSLWLGIQLSRDNGDPVMAATYSLLLKSMYPDSAEYKMFKESRK